MIGKITEHYENNILSVKGYIRTYAVDLEFRLEVRPNVRDEKSPSHDIIARGKHGKGFNAGVAWQGSNKKTGERMYTLAVNVPELFKDEMKLVAWDAKDGTFDIVYSKEKEQPQQQATAA